MQQETERTHQLHKGILKLGQLHFEGPVLAEAPADGGSVTPQGLQMLLLIYHLLSTLLDGRLQLLQPFLKLPVKADELLVVPHLCFILPAEHLLFLLQLGKLLLYLPLNFCGPRRGSGLTIQELCCWEGKPERTG